MCVFAIRRFMKLEIKLKIHQEIIEEKSPASKRIHHSKIDLAEEKSENSQLPLDTVKSVKLQVARWIT